MAAKPLKHTYVALGNLMTYSACEEALEGMEMCASNVFGGREQWPTTDPDDRAVFCRD
ncbi:hypothetical protein [Pseudomonas savastanoi]|uniref:hypothetical protein n=1 Tax=Pseudomonas savastanoi TaxID=29438 RepID=UPI0013C2B7BB|nr:hypothetical protein [Pseudomonas savastanoi]